MYRLTYLLKRWWLHKELRINIGIERTLQEELLRAHATTAVINHKIANLEAYERRRQIAGMIRDAV